MNDNDFINEMLSGERVMIGIITESGKILWISTDTPTEQQRKQFQKIYAITHKPSIVMNIVLFIEITILKILNFFEKKDKGTEH
tara:strand:- start:605 stop:856 length:252 start_codon:yes stop_codon:yes gene_type:complete